jgi:hypothetical protein
MNWINLDQDMDTIMNFRIPYIVGNLLAAERLADFSRRTQLHGDSLLSNKNLSQCSNKILRQIYTSYIPSKSCFCPHF